MHLIIKAPERASVVGIGESNLNEKFCIGSWASSKKSPFRSCDRIFESGTTLYMKSIRKWMRQSANLEDSCIETLDSFGKYHPPSVVMYFPKVMTNDDYKADKFSLKLMKKNQAFVSSNRGRSIGKVTALTYVLREAKNE
uniref:Uncharacterized protein n=1 Tax=Glossina pallidipes TaxID=7398 RepID=A0A1B0AHX2_GLOPL